MGKLEKRLKSVIAVLQKMADAGTLERAHAKALEKAIKKLTHAAKHRDKRRISTAIGEIAKLFLHR